MKCEFCNRDMKLLAKIQFYSEEAAYEWSESRVICENCIRPFGVELRRLFRAFVQPNKK